MPCGSWIMLPQAKECQWLPANQQKLGKGHGTDSPSLSSEGSYLTNNSQPSRLPELWSNKFMLLQDSERNLYASQEATVRTAHGTTDWFQIGKGYVKAVYCHPVYLTSIQSTSWETLDWKKYKMESNLVGEISIMSDMQMTSPLWQKAKKKTEEPLDEIEIR